MEAQRVDASQLRIGEPIPFDVYDAKGRLLTRKGATISSEDQVDRLVEQGLFFVEEERTRLVRDAAPRTRVQVPSYADRKVSVVRMLADARQALGALSESPEPEGFEEAVLAVADNVAAACRLDADAAVGSIVASRESAYPERHQVNCAVLACLVLGALGEPADVVREGIAAALTMNLAMLEIQQVLYRQKEALDAGQNAQVRSHPLRGERILRELGVARTHWLATVAQHHELVDGSGYPEALRGDAICVGARVLAVADQYCALVSERAYREGINPVLVAGKFRASPGTAFDPRVVAALLAQLGPYPPGALVHLAGGQIGVVCARTRSPQSPIVMACVSPQGVRYPVPRKKATSDSTSAIDRPMPQGALTPFPDAAELWADAYDVPARPPG